MTQVGRGLGVTETLRSLFDGSLELPLAVLTQLGDVWFLFVLAGTYYAVSTGSTAKDQRQQGAFVLALPIVYVALVGASKGLFSLPRPPDAGVAPMIPWLPAVLEPVFTNTATATGHGFPSGHALGTTVVWGGLALVADRWSPRTRIAGATGVVALVSFSRLALGVHYLVDVVAGALLGALVLLGLYRLSARATEPGRVFAVAVAVAAVGVLVQTTFDSAVALGGAVGAWLSWRALVDSELSLSVSTRAVSLSAAILLGTVALFGALYVLEPALPVMVAASAVAAALIVGVPDLGERLARRLDAP